MDAEKYAALADAAAWARQKHQALMLEIEAAANRVAAARKTYDDAMTDAVRCGLNTGSIFGFQAGDPEAYVERIHDMKFEFALMHVLKF